MAVDASGAIYIGDHGNGRVRRVGRSGKDHDNRSRATPDDDDVCVVQFARLSAPAKHRRLVRAVAFRAKRQCVLSLERQCVRRRAPGAAANVDGGRFASSCRSRMCGRALGGPRAFAAASRYGCCWAGSRSSPRWRRVELVLASSSRGDATPPPTTVPSEAVALVGSRPVLQGRFRPLDGDCRDELGGPRYQVQTARSMSSYVTRSWSN